MREKKCPYEKGDCMYPRECPVCSNMGEEEMIACSLWMDEYDTMCDNCERCESVRTRWEEE